MENEKIIVLNEVIVSKLESITYDIKYYINTNAGIAQQSLDEEGINAFKFMDNDEINELIEIRNRTKQLVRKLKNKLNS